MKEVDYSVVIPVFNSQALLIELFEQTKKVFDQLNQSFEMVLVDDSKNELTWPYILNLKEKYPGQIIGIRLARNYGQHNATICGFHHCQGQWIITMDDDLQVAPASIIHLIEQQKVHQSEVVTAYFFHKKHSFIKRIGSQVVKKGHSIFFGDKRSESSFRLIHQSIIRHICQHSQNFIYIDNVINWYTQSIDKVAVEHLPSKKGDSSYSFLKLVALFFDLIFNYTIIPLKIMTYGGFLFSLLTGFWGLFLLLKKIMWGAVNAPMGYSSLIVSILFSTSLLLFGMGILGEYIRRIYISLNHQPQFRIKQILK